MLEGLLQPMHLLMILGIALIVFGPARLPELGKGLGEAIRGFKGAVQGEPLAPSRAPLEAPDLLASGREASGTAPGLHGVLPAQAAPLERAPV